MFKQAITRTPSRSLVNGLTSANLGTPNYDRALEQHRQYVRALASCDVDVITLPASESFPDSVFIEDAALCTPHCAVITRPGADSRRGEAELLVPALRHVYLHVEQIVAPGTLDAGDVMMVGDHYFIGHSSRTNLDGAHQLIAILQRYGMTGSISPLQVKYDLAKCLHEGECRKVCLVPHVLELTKMGYASDTFEYIGADCTRCGMCVDVCPQKALSFSVRGLDKVL